MSDQTRHAMFLHWGTGHKEPHHLIFWTRRRHWYDLPYFWRHHMAAVTSITVDPGAAPVHVTVTDQANNPIPPGEITWTGEPTGVTVTPDDTGFNFAAPAGTVNVPSTEMTATYTPINTITGQLACVVQLTVTGLQFESP